MAGIEQRRARRAGLTMRAELREAGCARFSVIVDDLSATGFRCDTFYQLSVGARCFLHIPTFTPQEAIVAWKGTRSYGFRFAQPLHIAVFETIAARFPIV